MQSINSKSEINVIFHILSSIISYKKHDYLKSFRFPICILNTSWMSEIESSKKEKKCAIKSLSIIYWIIDSFWKIVKKISPLDARFQNACKLYAYF